MRTKNVGGLLNGICKNGCRWIYASRRSVERLTASGWVRVVWLTGCPCRSPRQGGDAKVR